MVRPGVPGKRLDLPCGESVSVRNIDLGTREFECDCGESHAVIKDTDPLTQFVPTFIADVLRDTVETDDDHPGFSTAHLLGLVSEVHSEILVSADVSDDGQVGYALLWVSGLDSRDLHRVVVEHVVDLMEQAIEEANDEAAIREFEEYVEEFDVEAFVEEYRAERDFEHEHDSAL